tara:strand:+ start:22 stop:399 length:378 start_codon:yes stop_codon:yes gene_type:complete
MPTLTIEIPASQHRKLVKIASTKKSWTVEKVGSIAVDKGLEKMKIPRKQIKIEARQFGRSGSPAIADNQCVKCGVHDVEFRDELSRKEFSISDLCQSCQDDIFGCGDDETLDQACDFSAALKEAK